MWWETTKLLEDLGPDSLHWTSYLASVLSYKVGITIPSSVPHMAVVRATEDKMWESIKCYVNISCWYCPNSMSSWASTDSRISDFPFPIS